MVTNVKKTGGHECGRISKVSKKLRKYFGPPGLSSCELLGGSEERQIFVVCFDDYCLLSSFQIHSPYFECCDDG